MNEAGIAFHDVDRIDSELHEADWAFARERAVEIDAHWLAAKAARPRMFDGRVLLMNQWRVETQGGLKVLSTRHFPTQFRTFLAFRDFGFPDPAIANCFAMAALVSAEGHFLLGEMAAHTANAGRIYFPAGTPDMNDVVDGRVDLAGSVLRELEEETGLTGADVACDAGWSIVHEGARFACMKTVRSPLSTSALVERIEASLRDQRDPELAGVHVVRTPGDLRPDAMPGFTLAWLARSLGAR